MFPFLIIIIAYNPFLSIDQFLGGSHGVLSEHRARNSLLCSQNHVFVTYRSMCNKRISHKVKVAVNIVFNYQGENKSA